MKEVPNWVCKAVIEEAKAICAEHEIDKSPHSFVRTQGFANYSSAVERGAKIILARLEQTIERDLEYEAATDRERLVIEGRRSVRSEVLSDE